MLSALYLEPTGGWTAADLRIEQAQKDLVDSLTKTVESLTTKLATADAKNSEYEAEREAKRAKKESFTVKELLKDLGLVVPPNRMNRFGSDIKKQFDAQYPGNTTFLKNKSTSFRSEDRVILESLVLKEHMKLEQKLEDFECVDANAGVDMEEFLTGSIVSEDYTARPEFQLEPQPPAQANANVDLAEWAAGA